MIQPDKLGSETGYAASPAAAHTKTPLEEKTAAVEKKVLDDQISPTTTRLQDKKITQLHDDRTAELKEKDSNLWICLSRVPNPNGGYIYEFLLRPEFQDEAAAKAKNDEIYPAIEPTLSSIKISLTNDFYNDLGISLQDSPKGKIFRVPDREALHANWSQEQVKRVEQVEHVMVDLKEFKRGYGDFSDWFKKDFIPLFRSEFEKELQLSKQPEQQQYDKMAACKELFKAKWGKSWSSENIDAFFKEFDEFFNDRKFEIKKRPTNDKVWEKFVAQWHDNYSGDTGLRTYLNQYTIDLAAKYKWLGVDFVSDTLVKETFTKYKDKEVPDEQWEKLRQQMQLPDLHIAEDIGIAGDLPFVSLILENDSLLSDKECIHDITYHVLVAIDFKCIARSDQEIATQQQIKQSIKTCYDKIIAATEKNTDPNDIEKLALALGIATDVIAADPYAMPFAPRDLIDMVWGPNTTEQTNPNFGIWKKRYPNEAIDISHIKEIWKKVLS